MNALSLFSGIGGLDLAAEAAGIRTVAMCEIDPFCREILMRRFPGCPVLGDINEINGGAFEGVDVIHGGFPCQDLSSAGEKAGLSGERSGLWYKMLGIIRIARPNWVVAENVRGAVNLALDEVVCGLEGAGYKVWPVVLPASAFEAPHQRYRLAAVGAKKELADACAERLQGGEWAESLFDSGTSACGSTPECCDASRMWPTPTVYGLNNRLGVSGKSGDGLATSVKSWATPITADCRGTMCGNGRSLRNDIREVHGTGMGSLNPDWVECLMGYPIGWTNPLCDDVVEWPGWPMGKGVEQHVYEPPRLTRRTGFRASRIKVLGNAVLRHQFAPFFRAIKYVHEGGGE